MSLGNIAPTQAKASEQTHEDVVWILNYLASHTIAIVCYKSSYMILRIHADVSYLSIKLFPIQDGGNHCLSDNSDSPPKNGSMNTIRKFMGNVMGSAAEGEIVFIYINDQYYVPVWTCLIKMGHPQPPTKIQIDNTTMEAFCKGNPKQKISKAIETRFYWIQDR